MCFNAVELHKYVTMVVKGDPPYQPGLISQ